MEKYNTINEHCRGCWLANDGVLCRKCNDGSCPCTICLMKMMSCDPDDNSYLTCDEWRDWFRNMKANGIPCS